MGSLAESIRVKLGYSSSLPEAFSCRQEAGAVEP